MLSLESGLSMRAPDQPPRHLRAEQLACDRGAGSVGACDRVEQDLGRLSGTDGLGSRTLADDRAEVGTETPSASGELIDRESRPLTVMPSAARPATVLSSSQPAKLSGARILTPGASRARTSSNSMLAFEPSAELEKQESGRQAACSCGPLCAECMSWARPIPSFRAPT
jgi:hypothetical protein